VTATKVVIWETDESFAEASLEQGQGTTPAMHDVMALDS
jgi:hypothetical protein